jgi:hypothetical protein
MLTHRLGRRKGQHVHDLFHDPASPAYAGLGRGNMGK